MTRVAIERNQKDNVVTARGYPEQMGDSAYFCFVIRLFLPDGVTMTDEDITELWQEEFEATGPKERPNA